MSTTKAPPRFEVVASEWDSNGSFRVIVRDNESAFRTAKTERSARDTARRVDTMRKVQWTRLDRVALTEYPAESGMPRMLYYFTVSRLEKSYR